MEPARNQPILLIAAGQGAVKTLAEVPHAARGLCVRVAGPFGLLVAGGPAGRVRTSSCLWLSDIRVPETGGETQAAASGSEQTLLKDLCSLVRRLRAGEDGSEGNGVRRTHIHAYAVIDLATPDIVAFTVRLLKLLRQAGPSIEMTGLALTGRTAQTGMSPEPAWWEPFGVLLAELENVHLLQRLYILDGEDANGTWLRDIEQMYRIGAEFILHHGMSPYRHSLRRRERTRMSLKEPFVDFCGSAMCKRFSWDSSVVAREVAATLARDGSVQELDQGSLSRERSEALDGLAQRLVQDISNVHENEGSSRGEASAPDASSGATGDSGQHERVRAAVERTLRDVCSTQPALSLHWFLKGLRPRLNGLMTFGRLRARREARFKAAGALRRQAEDTYTPIKEWQELSGVEWRAPTEPFISQPPVVMVSSPAPLGFYALAIGLAAVGLGGVALGLWRQQEAAMAAGGMLAIWASLLTVLPVKWMECRPTLIPHDGQPASRPPACDYQKYMPEAQAALSIIFLILGAGCLGWAILAGWKDAVVRTLLCGGFLAVGGSVAGVLIYLSTVRVSWPRKLPGKQETPDLAPPWNRRRYIAGLVALTVAWAALCIGAYSTKGTPNLLGAMAGLGSLLLGLVIAQLPRRGTAQLTCTIPRMPQKPADIEEAEPEGSHLATQVENLQSWVNRLLAAPAAALSGDLDWNETDLDDVLPKMFTSQWRRQLAEAFRRHQEMRSGRSLRQMVEDPESWTRYLMEGLSAPGFDLTDPLEGFWRHYVSRWLEEASLEHLIAQLGLDSQSLVSAIVANVPPRWPQPRGDCEVDTSAIAVGKELWSLMNQFADPDDPHRFAFIDWQDRNTVAVIRVVQGLSRGWRGFPVLPAQQALTQGGQDNVMERIPVAGVMASGQALS